MLIATRRLARHLRRQDGYTLIELMVAIMISMIVILAAFSLLEFTSRDVSRITDRAQADQTGRVALENIMLRLHSACVAVTVNPIQSPSSATELRLISETSPLNANNEPVSALATVGLHRYVYNASAGTLTEYTTKSTGQNTAGEFTFNESETPVKRLLLTHISQTVKGGVTLPIFQYYRYYRQGDANPELGRIAQNLPVTPSTPAEAAKVAKVAVNFTLAPEAHENSFAKGDRALPLEDAAVLRLAPASEAANSPNEPCTQT